MLDRNTEVAIVESKEGRGVTAARCLMAPRLAPARDYAITRPIRGLTDWARAYGVDGRSLHAWQMNLARRGTSSPMKRRKRAPSVAAHALVELVPAVTPIATGSGRYGLVVGGARLEFGDDVSVTTLRRVLEALRSC